MNDDINNITLFATKYFDPNGIDVSGEGENIRIRVSSYLVDIPLYIRRMFESQFDNWDLFFCDDDECYLRIIITNKYNFTELDVLKKWRRLK